MKMSDEMLNVQGVIGAPVVLTHPEPDWLAALKSGRLPTNVFSLYEAANFFSIDGAPRFLGDDDRWLFSFLTALGTGNTRVPRRGPRTPRGDSKEPRPEVHSCQAD
jgi:hypothetical protein